MLSHRDHFPLKIHTIKTTIAKVIFSGRMEIFKISNKNIILDGAHNPQKMTSFIKSLSNVFPQQKFTFVLAFKHKKDFSSMLRLILPFADFIFITNFSTNGQDMHQISEVTENIVDCLKQFKFSKYFVVKDPNQALKKAIKRPSPVVITGSLYLLSQIYCSVKKFSANFQI
jgi:folylpolyglutamate synthase/dihydropteroate synthase